MYASLYSSYPSIQSHYLRSHGTSRTSPLPQADPSTVSLMSNVSRVLCRDDTFDSEVAYKVCSLLYLPATYAMTYLLTFAMSICVLVHTVLYHGKSLRNGVKKVKAELDNIHAKLTRNYPEVPEWWYFTALCVFF